jgi:hypothetical protein
MKHIHFVIYRLKSIIFSYLFLLINLFLLFYSEIEFIKPSDDIKIQRKTINFTKDRYHRTVFINKKINSGIIRMFISFFYNFYIYVFYFVSQVLCICTHNHWYFGMRNIFFFYFMILFFFHLII